MGTISPTIKGILAPKTGSLVLLMVRLLMQRGPHLKTARLVSRSKEQCAPQTGINN
jgi:hypothetical protein